MDDFDFDGGDLPESPSASTTMARNDAGSMGFSSSMGSSSSNGRYADELASETVQAKFRTFYLDLKESGNGKFVKISEKSRGRKTTIMMDAEDVAPFMEAMQRIQSKM